MSASPGKKPKLARLYVAHNLIDGVFQPPHDNKYMDVLCPSTGQVVGQCGCSSDKDVDLAVAKGREAFVHWRQTTVKTRAAIMFKFHALMMQHQGDDG